MKKVGFIKPKYANFGFGQILYLFNGIYYIAKALNKKKILEFEKVRIRRGDYILENKIKAKVVKDKEKNIARNLEFCYFLKSKKNLIKNEIIEGDYNYIYGQLYKRLDDYETNLFEQLKISQFLNLHAKCYRIIRLLNKTNELNYYYHLNQFVPIEINFEKAIESKSLLKKIASKFNFFEVNKVKTEDYCLIHNSLDWILINDIRVPILELMKISAGQHYNTKTFHLLDSINVVGLYNETEDNNEYSFNLGNYLIKNLTRLKENNFLDFNNFNLDFFESSSMGNETSIFWHNERQEETELWKEGELEKIDVVSIFNANLQTKNSCFEIKETVLRLSNKNI